MGHSVGSSVLKIMVTLHIQNSSRPDNNTCIPVLFAVYSKFEDHDLFHAASFEGLLKIFSPSYPIMFEQYAKSQKWKIGTLKWLIVAKLIDEV